MKVKKAVIPAAGLGTRFLPATKSVPKELLPIVDTAILLHVVREAVAAGIEDIVIIAGRGKTAIEDFFDTSFELQTLLEKNKKEALLDTIREVQDMCNIISVRQKEAKGLGHAVYMAQSVVGAEPFAVLLGDEIMIPHQEGDASVTRQLVDIYESQNLSTVAVMEVPEDDVHKYGIIAIDENSTGMPLKVTSVVEKPTPAKAPSRWALPGRYVFTSKIFSLLEDLPPGKNGEVQLTDAMTRLAEEQGLLATSFSAQRFDAGDKFGFLQANLEVGLQHPEIGTKLREYLIERVKSI